MWIGFFFSPQTLLTKCIITFEEIPYVACLLLYFSQQINSYTIYDIESASLKLFIIMYDSVDGLNLSPRGIIQRF